MFIVELVARLKCLLFLKAFASSNFVAPGVMATLRTRGLCALGNVSNSPPPKRTKRTKAIPTCEDFEDSKDSDDGACAPKKKRKTKVCEDCKQTQPTFGLPPAKAKRWCSVRWSCISIGSSQWI